MKGLSRFAEIVYTFAAMVLCLIFVLMLSVFIGFRNCADGATYRNGKSQSTAQYKVQGRNDSRSYSGIPGGQTTRYNRPHINQPSTFKGFKSTSVPVK